MKIVPLWEYEKDEFVWELKQGFVKAAISIAVFLRVSVKRASTVFCTVPRLRQMQHGWSLHHIFQQSGNHFLAIQVFAFDHSRAYKI